jgi:NADH-quinone oxidoreductase subunit H
MLYTLYSNFIAFSQTDIFNPFITSLELPRLYSLFLILDLLLTKLIPLLIGVAYYTLLERKLMASIQRRKGPNVLGFWGSLQPLGDGLKLFLKENIIPYKANKFLFLLAPVWTFGLSIIAWMAIPFSELPSYFGIEYSLMFVYTISSLGIYGIIGSGWASNSKYAFLGALRSTAQMISYEVALAFVFLVIILLAGSMDLVDIVIAQKGIWFVFPLWPLALIFFISILAETNRAPFDLPEAEAEIVAGYNIEYSAMPFALFFLGEYANMLLMSSLVVLLFFGGWLPFLGLDYIFSGEFLFAFKIVIIASFIVIVRAAYPRVRYDQLMGIGWRWFLPFTLFFLIFIPSLYLLI